MDAAAQGSAALAASDFPSAITHYSNAISSNPQAVDYYIKRSMAHARTSPADYDSSLHDAEIAVALATKRAKRELIAESQLRRGVALYGLQRWGDAQQCFSWAGKYKYDEKVLKIWETKISAKLKELADGDEKGKVVVKEEPEVALPAVKDTKSAGKSTTSATSTLVQGAEKRIEEPLFVASKIRYDWYQSAENVVVSLFAKGIPKDQVKIDLHPKSLHLSFPTPSGGADFEYKLDALYAEIEPAASTSKITSTKIEITLRKGSSGLKWPSLQTSLADDTTTTTIDNTSSLSSLQSAQHPSSSTSVPSSSIISPPPSKPNKPTAPAYPTSSKTGPKDWDKLADSFAKKPKKPTRPDSQKNNAAHTTKSNNNSAAANDKNASASDVASDEDEGIDYDMDGGDEVGAFFKQIYKGASPDARRAMMKSYQESNGTALSTNWDEVGKGKVETVPPAGMEVRKW